jgi:hypothetical protein
MNRNVKLLYGFSFFDPFMIVIPVWVPYLATQGISMRQFMELQAVFAIVIFCGEVPTGLLSDDAAGGLDPQGGQLFAAAAVEQL